MCDIHNHTSFSDYRSIPMSECLPLAERLQAAGTKWHSHVLSPACRHNPFPEVYAIVIEDGRAGTAYIAEGSATFPEVDKDLVKMLHGEDIIDATKLACDPPASILLHNLNWLQERRISWHHHMHFPTCVFNPHPGQWSISVEAPNISMSEAYSDEPIEVLRRVEVLYFANLEDST
ncbi:hypothetical protein [Solirhodobacter olei]|uniref:hypothetical protein n=1 Tax=Solirhodobacter olei TaxID=2493082 RepID=UPI000FDBD662|nr:hypothetical protein [Solirhodobacter olei]